MHASLREVGVGTGLRCGHSDVIVSAPLGGLMAWIRKDRKIYGQLGCTFASHHTQFEQTCVIHASLRVAAVVIRGRRVADARGAPPKKRNPHALHRFVLVNVCAVCGCTFEYLTLPSLYQRKKGRKEGISSLQPIWSTAGEDQHGTLSSPSQACWFQLVSVVVSARCIA